MDFAGIVDIALPVVYVLVGAVLVWFVVELALTIRSTRSTIDDAHKAVSYTHLDVYKRQVRAWLAGAQGTAWSFRSSRRWLCAVPSSQLSRSARSRP